MTQNYTLKWFLIIFPTERANSKNISILLWVFFFLLRLGTSTIHFRKEICLISLLPQAISGPTELLINVLSGTKKTVFEINKFRAIINWKKKIIQYQLRVIIQWLIFNEESIILNLVFDSFHSSAANMWLCKCENLSQELWIYFLEDCKYNFGFIEVNFKTHGGTY